jgi:EAL domain-containing protein (putative c-di-GMP-specific phosphodiesterase class I)/CheY-like chemotaxis protein
MTIATIPASSRPAPTGLPALGVCGNGEEPKISLRGRIVLVDDDDNLLRAFGRALERAGHDVTRIGDGRAACELMANLDIKEVDVVVTDLSMPGAGGLDVMRAAHRLDPDLPVLLMTGLPSVETAVQALERGAFRYLLKPIEPEALREAVDRAVELRQSARSRVPDVPSTSNPPSSRARLELSQRFDVALQRLWMAFQPIVCFSQKRIHAYEALVRTDEATLARPDHFFNAAEQLGRVQQLGRTIRAAVARAIVNAPDDVLIFVNLHASDLADDELYSASSPLAPYAQRIVFEITERASLDRFRDIQDRVASLRAHGYRVAVDDLGAGYAALSSLASLQPEVVKLDMSLVRGVDQQPIKRRLVASLQTLGEPLGITVVAEGVETIAERDTLLAVGCDLFQGYLFAKPQRGFPSVNW